MDVVTTVVVIVVVRVVDWVAVTSTGKQPGPGTSLDGSVTSVVHARTVVSVVVADSVAVVTSVSVVVAGVASVEVSVTVERAVDVLVTVGVAVCVSVTVAVSVAVDVEVVASVTTAVAVSVVVSVAVAVSVVVAVSVAVSVAVAVSVVVVVTGDETVEVAVTVVKIVVNEVAVAGTVVVTVWMTVEAGRVVTVREVVVVAVTVLNARLVVPLLPYVVPPFIVGLLVLLVGVPRLSDEPASSPGVFENPLQVVAALQMAALFQCVSFAVYGVRQYWGDAGVVPSGAVLGLTDMDALAISMARGAATGIPVELAARAIAMGVLANNVLKLTVAIALGQPGFRRIAAGSLAAMALAGGLTLAWR